MLGVTRQALNNVVNGKSGISPEMAIRLSKAFGSTAERGCGCSLLMTSQQRVRTKARSKFDDCTSKSCTCEGVWMEQGIEKSMDRAETRTFKKRAWGTRSW